jgi:hypothetical protein
MKTLLVLLFLFAPGMYAQTLPDAPQPKPLEQRLHERYPDLFHMDKPVATTGQAARQPSMVALEGLLLAATVVDIEGTQHCIHNHTCREANPLLGKSRARQYGISMPLATVALISAAKARRDGHGNIAAFFIWSAAVVHVAFGVKGFRE